jgi:Flp pilus assembly protein TadD/mono/diheme cytochrome c family protein
MTLIRITLALTLAAFATPRLAAQSPTYRSQIAPILARNCTSCHHTGGSGPFPLTSYTFARRYAAVLDTAVATRYMPPWLPEPGHAAFQGDRRLSDKDIATLHAWVAAGSPEGSGPIPAPPTYPDTWQLGPPDLVLELPTAISIPASGTDLFTNVILPNPLKSTRWVRAMEIKPGSPRVVHHANVILDRTASLRRTHLDWQRGIPGMDINVDSGDAFDPDSHFLFWKPDSTALVEPESMPWRLDPGTDLVLNLHLKPSGKPESTRIRIALYFTPTPATAHPMLLQLENDSALDIPPGASAFPVEDSLTLPVAVDVLGIYPHAHYLARRMEAWATLPDGSRRDLILIPDWDIDRQSVYRLATPLPLPAGTTLHMRYLYDNSAANIRNPHTPPIRVTAGNRSEDEMAHFWLQVLPHPTAGTTELAARQSLERAWMEQRLTKSPNDLLALYNLASLDFATGNPVAAIPRYRQILGLTPPSQKPDPRTLTALGSALQAVGQTGEAREQFRAALAVEPSDSNALFDLAALDLDAGIFDEAEALLRRAIQAHPEDGEAHHLLGIALAAQNKLADALTQLQAWQASQPQSPEPHRALAQILSQMERMPEAIDHQRAALALTPNSASDWNDLGVFEARAGRKQDAARDFRHALALDPNLKAAASNLSKL